MTIALERTREAKTARKPETAEDVKLAVWQTVQLAQLGDSRAVTELYERYQDVVFRFIYFRVGNRPLAEDLAQDVWVRALKRVDKYEYRDKDFGAWLVTIARNIVADYFKSGRCRLEVAVGTISDSVTDERGGRSRTGHEPSPEGGVVDHIMNVTLLTAVKQLNPEQQECIVLRFLRGFSVAETAQAMGKQEGAVKALQYRAVRALARLLPEGFSPWTN